MVLEENFLFSKKCAPQKPAFSYLCYQLINYDNLIVTKQFTFPQNSENRGFTSLIIFRCKKRPTLYTEYVKIQVENFDLIMNIYWKAMLRKCLS